MNRIRERVDAWRDAEYPGVTNITRELLRHWHDRSARQHPFFFCQLEAIETLIWWVEAPPNAKKGIHVPSDGGPFERICNKMATGSGKTTVMSMIITSQVLNAVTFPKETKRFSKAVFIVAPGITVKDRLRVLLPGEPDNVYDQFGLCPTSAMRQRLNQAVIMIENWHTLMPLKEQSRSVVKKGKESDKAYVRRVLGALSQHPKKRSHSSLNHHILVGAWALRMHTRRHAHKCPSCPQMEPATMQRANVCSTPSPACPALLTMERPSPRCVY